VLATRGQWVTNEKTLLDRAGLRPGIDAILTSLTPDALNQAITAAESELRAAVHDQRLPDRISGPVGDLGAEQMEVPEQSKRAADRRRTWN
jgi:hypothetical protein